MRESEVGDGEEGHEDPHAHGHNLVALSAVSAKGKQADKHERDAPGYLQRGGDRGRDFGLQ